MEKESSLREEARPVSHGNLTRQSSAAHATELRENSSVISNPKNQKPKDSLSIIEFHKNDPLDRLSENERGILHRELYLPPVNVSYQMLFRYASKVDLLILIISASCAAGSGAVMPLMTVCSRIPATDVE
jgi:hypothetical protein